MSSDEVMQLWVLKQPLSAAENWNHLSEVDKLEFPSEEQRS